MLEEETLYPILIKQKKRYNPSYNKCVDGLKCPDGLVTKRPSKLSTEEKKKIEDELAEFESAWASIWAFESSLILIDGRPLWERRHGE